MRHLPFVLRRLLLVLVAITTLLTLVAFLFPQRLMTIDSGDVQADAMVVLGGGTNQLRPEHAADLFKQGKAPVILISGQGDDNLCHWLMLRHGVPESAIKIEGASKSTLENAKFSVARLRQMNAHRVILVTTWYHSRRAMACFQRAAPDMKFYSCPSYWGYSRNEWLHPGVLWYIGIEYVKLLGYWVVYGVCPLWVTSPGP